MAAVVVSAQQLVACGVKAPEAMVFAPRLSTAFNRFGVTTPKQQAAFVAQAIWESSGFTRLAENLNYSKADYIWAAFERLHPLGLAKLNGYTHDPVRLGNLAYAGINGNGNEASGDGFKYRGGGIFQLTGKGAYLHAGTALGVDFVTDPDKVRTNPDCASLTAGLYWSEHGCGAQADADNFDGVTQRINGGQNGAEGRRKLYALTLPVFSRSQT